MGVNKKDNAMLGQLNEGFHRIFNNKEALDFEALRNEIARKVDILIIREHHHCFMISNQFHYLFVSYIENDELQTVFFQADNNAHIAGMRPFIEKLDKLIKDS